MKTIYVVIHVLLDWALPDQLVYSTVTALLRLATKDLESRVRIIQSIMKFAADVVSQMKSRPCELVVPSKLDDCSCTKVSMVVREAYPAFHGLYRALISTSFAWTIAEWLNLSDILSELLEANTVDRLNDLLSQVLELSDSTAHVSQTLLERYVTKDRPLSGYFAVCCVMEIQWTVLAQTLVSTDEDTPKSVISEEEAAAANAAWNVLVSKRVVSESYSHKVLEGLKGILNRAMECFTDLLAQMGEMDDDPSIDTYAWETMAECLVSRFIFNHSYS